MYLSDYIERFYGGNQRRFAEAQDVLPQQVTRWLRANAVVFGGKIHTPLNRDLAPVVDTSEYNRATFEAKVLARKPGADLTREDFGYADERIHSAWGGWVMAQEHLLEQVHALR